MRLAQQRHDPLLTTLRAVERAHCAARVHPSLHVSTLRLRRVMLVMYVLKRANSCCKIKGNKLEKAQQKVIGESTSQSPGVARVNNKRWRSEISTLANPLSPSAFSTFGLNQHSDGVLRR